MVGIVGTLGGWRLICMQWLTRRISNQRLDIKVDVQEEDCSLPIVVSIAH